MKNAGADARLDLEAIWVEEGLKRKVNRKLFPIIGQLSKAYSVGVLSNLTPSRLLLDKKIDLYSPFHYKILSCEARLKKPDPAFYQLALDAAYAKPEAAIFIDDREEYVSGAEALGIKGILFTFPDNARLLENLRELGIMI